MGRVCTWVEYRWAIGWSTGGDLGGVRVGNWVDYGVGNWVEYGWARERSMRYVGRVVSHLHIVTLLCRYCHSLCH